MGYGTRQDKRGTERKGTGNFLKRKKPEEHKIVMGNGIGMRSRQNKNTTGDTRHQTESEWKTGTERWI